MSKINRLKLAKLLLKFAEVETDKGLLTYEGELVVGNEVFIEKDGELIPAEDGEYVAEDKTITVKDGKIAEIVEINTEDEQPAPEEEVVVEGVDVENPTDNTIKDDEKDAKIAELESVIAEKDAEIESLKAEIEEMKTKLQMSTDKSPKEKMKEIEDAIKQNPALKYFK